MPGQDGQRAQGSGWDDTPLFGDKHTHTHLHIRDEGSVPSYLLPDPNLYLSPLTSAWGIDAWIVTASLTYWSAHTPAKLWTLTYAHINTRNHVCIIHTHTHKSMIPTSIFTINVKQWLEKRHQINTNKQHIVLMLLVTLLIMSCYLFVWWGKHLIHDRLEMCHCSHSFTFIYPNKQIHTLCPSCTAMHWVSGVFFVYNFDLRIPRIVAKGLSPFSVCCLLRINVHYVLLICILQRELN